MHIKLTNGIPEKYTIGQLRRDNPQVSFPKNIPDATLAEYDVYPLTATERPSYDPITQNLTEGTPALIKGVWTQVWEISEATPEEIGERKAEQRGNIQAERANAYREEADPLFFKAQRGEAEVSEWENKVQEIRDRFPYPTEG